MTDFQRICVGIDLGTYYCSVGYWNKDKIHIIPDVNGHRKTTSWLTFDTDEFLVGEAARQNMSGQVIYDILSLVGMRHSEVNAAEMLPFRVCTDGDDGIVIQVSYKGQLTTFYPQELLALLLRRVKSDIELNLRQEVTDVVLSISLMLTLKQRRSIRDACTLAGLKLSKILYSPTASAFAFASLFMHNPEEVVMVVDCGGGSVGVSLAVVEQGICEIKAVAGTTQCGGRSFDHALMQYFGDMIRLQLNLEVFESPTLLVRLRLACEQTKIALSTSFSSSIIVENIKDGVDFKATITRAEFESIICNQLNRCLAAVDDALALANMTPSQVQRLLLTGMSSRIPKIQDMLHRHFDGNLTVQIADECLSPMYGAAMNAAQISGVPRLANDESDLWLYESLLLDVQTNAIGIVGPDSSEVTIVRRGVISIPLKKTISITTVVDNQTSIAIPVWEGKGVGDGLQENFNMGTVNLTGIPPAPAGEQSVDITVDVDAYQECKVLATLTGSAEKLAELSLSLEQPVSPPLSMVTRHNDMLFQEWCLGGGGVMSRTVDADNLEDGSRRSSLAGMFPLDLPQVSLEAALAFCTPTMPAVMASMQIALKKAKMEELHPALSMDERAAVILYTIEAFPKTESVRLQQLFECSRVFANRKFKNQVNYILNSALRSVNRRSVQPWRDYMWLLLHGLKKLPPTDCRVVHRAVLAGLHELGMNYCLKDIFEWSAFTSATTHVDALQASLGHFGKRTIFELELSGPVTKDISQFSHFPINGELLLPPNIIFEVVSILKCENGLHIIKCREIDKDPNIFRSYF